MQNIITVQKTLRYIITAIVKFYIIFIITQLKKATFDYETRGKIDIEV